MGEWKDTEDDKIQASCESEQIPDHHAVVHAKAASLALPSVLPH